MRLVCNQIARMKSRGTRNPSPSPNCQPGVQRTNHAAPPRRCVSNRRLVSGASFVYTHAPTASWILLELRGNLGHGRHTTDTNAFTADYGNEKECGEGVARAIKDGLVKREELFIVSKLWNSFHDGDRVEPICKKQLADWYVSYEQTKFPGLACSQGDPGELCAAM